jgi:class 3 adenylate cyclase
VGRDRTVAVSRFCCWWWGGGRGGCFFSCFGAAAAARLSFFSCSLLLLTTLLPYLQTPQQNNNSIFLPYPRGLDANTIYSSRFFGFAPTPPAPFDCGPPDCVNATHYLWGLSTVVVDWPKLRDSSLLASLPSEGYSYQLLRPDTNDTTTAAAAAAAAAAATPPAARAGQSAGAQREERQRRRASVEYVLAGQDAHLKDSVAVSVDVLGTPWTLELAPASGSWKPAWRAPLVAAVALASATTGLLVLSTLKAQHQHYALLRRMLPDKVIRRLRNAALFYAEQHRRRRRRARRRAIRLGLGGGGGGAGGGGDAGGGGGGYGSPSPLSRRLWALWYRMCGLIDPSMGLSGPDADVSVHSKHGGGGGDSHHGSPHNGGTGANAANAPLPPAYVESVSSATVLFSDIVSYTSLAAAMRPEAIVAMLNEVFSAYEAICLEERVHKVETIGDGFMAVAGGQFLGEDDATMAGGGGGGWGEGGGGGGGWLGGAGGGGGGCFGLGGGGGLGVGGGLRGRRDSNNNSDQPCGAVEAAERAAALALRMVQATAGLSLQERISIRVGLHSGPVVAAVVGRAVPRLSFFGDTVNTASRMETASLPGFVHLSEATARLLASSPRGRWDVQPRGEIQVKGKGVMRTYFLHGYDPGPERLPGSPLLLGEEEEEEEGGGEGGRALSGAPSSSRDLEAARSDGDGAAASEQQQQQQQQEAAAKTMATPARRRPRALFAWLPGSSRSGAGGGGPRPAAIHPVMGVGPLQGRPIPPAPPPGAAQGSMPSFTSTDPPPLALLQLQQRHQQQQLQGPTPPGSSAASPGGAHAAPAPSFASRPGSAALDEPSQSRLPSGLWRGLSGGSSVLRAGGGGAQSSFTSGSFAAAGGAATLAAPDARWGGGGGRQAGLPPRRREPPSREASLRSMRVSSLHLDTRERYGAILDIAARHPATPTGAGGASAGGTAATGAAVAAAGAAAAAAAAAATAAAGPPPARCPSSGTGVDSIVEGDDEDGTGGNLTTGSTMRTMHGSVGSSGSGGGGGGVAAAALVPPLPPPAALFPGDAADGVIYYGASADGGAVLPPPSSPRSQPSMGGR